MWDVKTGKLHTDLPGHQDEVFAVDWSPDGKKVSSGGKDKVSAPIVTNPCKTSLDRLLLTVVGFRRCDYGNIEVVCNFFVTFVNTVYIICTTKSDFGVLKCAWFWSAGLFGTVVIEILHRFSDFTSYWGS